MKDEEEAVGRRQWAEVWTFGESRPCVHFCLLPSDFCLSQTHHPTLKSLRRQAFVEYALLFFVVAFDDDLEEGGEFVVVGFHGG